MLEIYFNPAIDRACIKLFRKALFPITVRGTGSLDWTSGPITRETFSRPAYVQSTNVTSQIVREAITLFYSEYPGDESLLFNVVSDGDGTVVALIDYWVPEVDAELLLITFPHCRVALAAKEDRDLTKLQPPEYQGQIGLMINDLVRRFQTFVRSSDGTYSLDFDSKSDTYNMELGLGSYRFNSAKRATVADCIYELLASVTAVKGLDQRLPEWYLVDN